MEFTDFLEELVREVVSDILSQLKGTQRPQRKPRRNSGSRGFDLETILKGTQILKDGADVVSGADARQYQQESLNLLKALLEELQEVNENLEALRKVTA